MTPLLIELSSLQRYSSQNIKAVPLQNYIIINSLDQLSRISRPEASQQWLVYVELLSGLPTVMSAAAATDQNRNDHAMLHQAPTISQGTLELQSMSELSHLRVSVCPCS